MKFSASILDNQDPSLRIVAISINSELVDRSASKTGDIFLTKEISDFTVGEGE